MNNIIFNLLVFFFLNSCFLNSLPIYNTYRWMGDLKAQIGNLPLNKLVIPSTHDSASNRIDPSNPDVAIAQGGELHQIANLGLGIVMNFAKTQNLTVYEQLLAGARSLDLRVAWRDQKKIPGGIFVDGTKDFLGKEQLEGVQGPKGLETTYYKNFWTHHGAYSQKFDEVLGQIRRFLDENKEEIVILNFGNLYNMDENRHKEMAKRIRDILGANNPIAPSNISPDKTSLADLLKRGVRVIVILDDENKAQRENFWYGNIFGRPNPPQTICLGTWANKQKFADLLDFLKQRVLKRVEDFNKNEFCQNRLWNSGLTLTPDENMIKESLNVFKTDRIQNIKQLDDTIKKDEIIKYFIDNKINPNIVSVDFFNSDIGKRIIGLNLLL